MRERPCASRPGSRAKVIRIPRAAPEGFARHHQHALVENPAGEGERGLLGRQPQPGERGVLGRHQAQLSGVAGGELRQQTQSADRQPLVLACVFAPAREHIGSQGLAQDGVRYRRQVLVLGAGRDDLGGPYIQPTRRPGNPAIFDRLETDISRSSRTAGEPDRSTTYSSSSTT